ncbi:MAG TPA: lipopolysaccharide kinase InaA family protein [Tepidisphaeraceae bacterium]|jgi:hypothetical protein
MFGAPKSILRVAPQYQPIFRELGIDADLIFKHPLIKPWRKLGDRENCTLDATLQDGQKIRWHVKRYQPAMGFTTPAEDEFNGHRALTIEQIPTPMLVAYGKLGDRRSFVIFEDLAGYAPADKLIESGETTFERLLNPTADLAAKLHRSGLHHRDLYLCHFFVRVDGDAVNVELIDPARVKRLPGILTRTRWIVKDLAQFWYSTTKHKVIAEAQRDAWLSRYAQQRGLKSPSSLRRKIDRKVAWIAKHDAQLRKQQPDRNISIPTAAQ